MTIKKRNNASSAFTIIELFVVIVIIGVIATITIVAYRGIQHNAAVAVIKNDLKQANLQLDTARVEEGAFPDTLDELNNGNGLKFATENTTFYYTDHNELDPKDYCLTAVVNGEAFKVTRFTAPTEGYCEEQVPAGPTPTATTDSTTQITVEWDDVADADSYRLEYDTSSGFGSSTSIEDIEGTQQAVSGLNSNTTYYFRVYATNALGEGSASETVSALTDALLPEGTPTITATTNSSTQITVSWSSITNASHYRLEYSTNSGLTGATTIDDITGTSQAVTGLSQGVRYYFGLYAVSEGGDSPRSNIANSITTINAPDSPSVSASIPGSARAWNSGTWARDYLGRPTSGNWYYAQASISSSTCPSGTSREWRARVQYNSPTTWGAWSSWTTGTYIYAIGPSSGYGMRYQAQTRCYTSVADSPGSSYGYGCRWASGSTSCSGF